MFYYTSKYRPVLSEWVCTKRADVELVETGTLGHYPLRADLPRGETRHGVIAVPVELTADEIERSDLERYR